jgi:hypothetical protein
MVPFRHGGGAFLFGADYAVVGVFTNNICWINCLLLLVKTPTMANKKGMRSIPLIPLNISYCILIL